MFDRFCFYIGAIAIASFLFWGMVAMLGRLIEKILLVLKVSEAICSWVWHRDEFAEWKKKHG
jgi:hypothetical protein